MELHGNARLTPHGRTLMCQRVRHDGWTVAEAAEAAGCSERTTYRWLARYDAGEAQGRLGVISRRSSTRRTGALAGPITTRMPRAAHRRTLSTMARTPLTSRKVTAARSSRSSVGCWAAASRMASRSPSPTETSISPSARSRRPEPPAPDPGTGAGPGPVASRVVLMSMSRWERR